MSDDTLLALVSHVALGFIPMLLAITVHEVAHGWVAKQLGDPTADKMGRLTLNPIKHIDLIGTIILPSVLLVMFSGFVFGWAKPVPVNPGYFKSPKRGMMWVALAGPIANLLMALIWSQVVHLGVIINDELWTTAMLDVGKVGISVNLALAALNLIPIPPLDGSRVLAGLLPNYLAMQIYRMERIGLIIVMVLLYQGMLGKWLAQPLYYLHNWFFTLAGM